MKDKSLVIVESPTKAKTIGKILGSNYTVISSMGHLIDLPQKTLGVDIENHFEPQYTVIASRKKVMTELKKEAKQKATIYIATDPDREGEAIGWHLKDKLFPDSQVQRVVFHEITQSAIKSAFEHPRDFDRNMVEAQIGRRVLDRIVGYFLSPLLWKKIVRGLSAGRVQSVALKLIIDRERQIQGFVPKEYWEIEAQFKKAAGEEKPFNAKLAKIDGKEVQIDTREQAEAIAADLKTKQCVVSDIKKTEKKRNPDPPFITSTLQQEAFNKLRYNANKTMLLAQQLYEGIDVGTDSPVGLITYMRTDSTAVAQEAVAQAREFIVSTYGKDYLPDTPPVYKVKKFAQQAHEAIRPTLVSRTPESLKTYLNPDQLKLYELIYNRFVASQMMPSRSLVTTVSITADQYLFTASGSQLVFDGFTRVYNRNEPDDEEKKEEKEEKAFIPVLEKLDILTLVGLNPSQHFTKPPPRYSDSSLVKALEEEGIGRPSTYAPTIATLLARDYVRRLKGYFHPTELGFKVCDLLVEYFPSIMDLTFTAQMEEKLDEIEEGQVDKIKVLEEFYAPFKKYLDFAQNNIQKDTVTTEEKCPLCGRPLVIKWGRKGKFLSCSGYPECKGSKSITTGVKCPSPGCTGELIERRSVRGFFYGCTQYPKCTYTSRSLPEEKEGA